MCNFCPATDRKPATPSSALRTGWKAKSLANVTASDEVSMRDALDADKRALLSALGPVILEIGPGTGPNFAYYAPGSHVIGVEPNAFVQPELQRKVEEFSGTFELRVGTAETLDLPDDSVDAVVSTMVLCSVDDVEAALSEILRVLKPGGRFAFLEHVVADTSSLKLLQYAAVPFWRTFGDGCCPVRRTHRDIEAAGFGRVDYRKVRYPFPIPVSASCIVGTAVK